MPLKSGEPAPAFSLPDQTGTTHSLADYRGKWVLLYFYPKDDTPGCTKEACAIRDHFPAFGTLDAVVFGVSADPVKSHAKFAEKYDLPFPLLADERAETVKAYDAWGPKKFMGKEFLGVKRVSYLIDPAGRIAKAYPKVKAAEHAEEVLGDLGALQG